MSDSLSRRPICVQQGFREPYPVYNLLLLSRWLRFRSNLRGQLAFAIASVWTKLAVTCSGGGRHIGSDCFH